MMYYEKSTGCPRCDTKLERKDEYDYCSECDWLWDWTGSSWMGKKNTKEKGPESTTQVPLNLLRFS